MGLTIQFESHRVELAAIYEMEYDADVLEYWDQPPSIKLDYRSPAGRRLGVLHTPDFFVIRQNSAGWEEWKAVEDLRQLAEHNPNRYCLDNDGQWRSRPGKSTRRDWASIIGCALAEKSTGCFNAMPSSSKTIFVRIRRPFLR
jgi:putative transposase